MRITSKDNPSVKLWRDLCQSTKHRRRQGLCALEGARLCGDAVRSGLAIETALITPHGRDTYPETVALLEQTAGTVLDIDDALGVAMADTTTPQGIFCIAKLLDNRLKSDTINTVGRYAVLEDMQDPGNMGTVIRTAEALGLDGLILSEGCCDLFNPKVLRGSMGGVFRVQWFVTEDLPATLTALQKKGMTAYACVVDASATPVSLTHMGVGSLCVIGNEGNGLKEETVRCCRERITIPMQGRAESLNASMAAGIVMWEMMRGEPSAKEE